MTRRTRLVSALLCCAVGCAAQAPAEPTPLEPIPDRTGVWIEFGEMELSPNAVLPEGIEGFEGAEVLADRLVLDFGGATPIEVGDVVAGGGMSDGYMRVAEAVRTLEDGRQEVMTRQAGLDELFTQYEIEVHGRPRELPDAATEGLATEALTERFNWRECVGGRFPWSTSDTLPGGRCGDLVCDASERGSGTCAGDCGSVTCGDGTCAREETVAGCSADCRADTCGNNSCDRAAGETETSCPADCAPSWARATAPPATTPTACGGAPEPTNTCTTSGEVVAEVCPYLDWEPNFDWGVRPIEAYANVDTSLTAGVTATAGARVMAHCSADFVRMLGLPDRLNLANLSQTWVIGCIPIGPSCIPVYFGVEALVFAEPILQGEMDFRFDTGEVVANAQVQAQVRSGASVGLGGISTEFEPSITPTARLENSRAGAVRIETGIRAGVVLRLAVGVRVSVGVPPLPTIPAALLERVGVAIPTSVSIGAGAYVQLELIAHLNSIFENDFSGCGFRAEVPYCFEGNISAGAYVTTPIPGVGVNVSGRFPLFSVSGTLYSNAEDYEECMMMPTTCMDSTRSCMDTVVGAEVCDGDHGFMACDPGPDGEARGRRCLCTAGGFTDCTDCAALPTAGM